MDPAIGKKIKELREKADLTQKGLGLKMKMTNRQIQRYEDGAEIPLNKLIKLGEVLKYDFLRHIKSAEEDQLNNPLPLGNLVVTLGDYVELLKKQVEVYQKIAETNLGTILKNQEIGGGIVQEILERDVLKETKGNPKKAAEILEAIRLKIAKTSGIALIKYTHDGEGIARK